VLPPEDAAPLPPLVPGATVHVGSGPPLRVAVARTAEEQRRGLMFRDSLGETDGMLFVLARRGLHAFWMKGVRIPLDIAWIDERGAVVDVAADVPPCVQPPCTTYAPRAPARYALEVPAGVLASRGVAPGASVSIDWT
jgi:hypothetical protein